MGGPPVLEIEDVSMEYLGTGGSVTALDRVGLTLRESDFVCVVGPSGCGKTTLLRIIAGFVEPTGGSVRLDGSPILGPDHQRGVVFQQPALYPWLTVQDNVEFGPKMRGIEKARRRELAEHYLRMMRLWEFRAKPPYELSGGMQQRVAIARVLANDPKILLMDEPFAAVDMQTRELLQEELLKIWNTTETTVLFVTHSVEEAVYLGDRVIVMAARPGRIRADVRIDLPRPRYATDVKSSPRFGELTGRLRELLRSDTEEAKPSTVSSIQSPARRERKFSLTDHPNAVRIASLALTLGVWEWYGRGVDPIFFSYPTAIAAALPAMIAKGELQRALFMTLQGLSIGFVLAVVFGIVIGLLMGRYRLFDYLLDVQISALYSTPNVALIPLLILWFGLGMDSKIAIVFLAAFFPIIVNTYGGVRNVSRGLVEIAQAEGASEAQIFGKIILPASLPFIMTGIRLAVGRAVVGMVVAEMFTAMTGLGGAIVYYSNAFATDKLFVVIILLALLGVALTEGVKFLEVRLAPWKETERAN